MKSFGNIAKDSEIRAVASGSLTNGKPVIINADGTVSIVAQSGASAGTPAVYETGAVKQAESRQAAVYDTGSDRIIVAYRDQNNSNYGTALVGTVSSGSVSFGTGVVFASAESNYIDIAYDSNANKVVIVYSDAQGDGNAIVGTVDSSDNSISYGSSAEYSGTGVSKQSVTFDSTANKVVVTYKGADQHGHVRVGTVSGTSISFGNDNEWQTAQTNEPTVVYDSNADRSVITYVDASNSDKGAARVGTVSGTGISLGSEVIFHTGTCSSISSCFDSTNNKIVTVFANNGDNRKGTAQVGTVSGTSISYGTAAVFNAASTDDIAIDFDSTNGKVIISFTDDGDSGKGKAVVGTVSGTSISFTDPIEFEGGDTNNQAVAFDPDTNQSIIFYCDVDDSEKGKYVTFSAVTNNITSENFVGFLDGKSESISESIGSATVFNTANSENIAAAYDSTNSKVVVFSKDGGSPDNLEAVVGTVSNGSISFGSAAEFHAGGGEYISAAFDSSNGKLVVAYKKTSDNYLYSKVGTVSGTDISFGSEAAVDTTGTVGGSTVTFDSTNNKIVVAYDVGSNGHAKVGTISGTDISYGSRATFESASVSELDSVFDTDNGKVVIAYKDEGNSNYGTAVIGTVSGTSISFGTPVVFESAVTKGSINYVGSSKVFIGSQVGGGTGTRDGKGIVGTVSGTSISFGSAVVFESDDVRHVSSVYHSAADKVIVFYQDNGNSDYGSYVIGTISGTSVSFTSSAVFESATVSFVSSVYDSNDERAVAFYRDEGDSSKGTSITYRPSFTKSTTVLDGVSTSIKTANSISRSQSGLTAGQTYFVQNDGTLSETAASPSVTAGTAISATELIVKG